MQRASLVVLSVVALGTLSGCLKPSGKAVEKSDDALPSAQAGQASGTAPREPGAKLEISLTAEAPGPRPALDVLVVIDQTQRMTAAPFPMRLRWMADSILGRLTHGDIDFRLGVAAASAVAATETDPARVGAWIVPKDDKEPPVLTPATAELDKVFRQRFVVERVEAPENHQPLTATLGALEAATQSGELMRENAELVVFIVNLANETFETTAPGAITEWLDAHKGRGRWHIGIVDPGTNGCYITDAERTDPPGTLRKGSVLALTPVATVRGACDRTYADFADDVILRAGRLHEGPSLLLSDDAAGESIEVLATDMPVHGWTFDPATHRIALPAQVKAGAQLDVRYARAPTSTAFEAPAVKDGVPPILEKALSPEERRFRGEINPILQRYCSCHGNGSNLQVFVDNYKNTVEKKSSILMRIELPVADPLRMPTNGRTLQQADLDALTKWLNEP
jgi:hypothetical protein